MPTQHDVQPPQQKAHSPVLVGDLSEQKQSSYDHISVSKGSKVPLDRSTGYAGAIRVYRGSLYYGSCVRRIRRFRSVQARTRTMRISDPSDWSLVCRGCGFSRRMSTTVSANLCERAIAFPPNNVKGYRRQSPSIRQSLPMLSPVYSSMLYVSNNLLLELLKRFGRSDLLLR